MKKIFKLNWLSKDWREGSMGAAEKESFTRFAVIGTVVLGTVLSMLWFNIFNTYLFDFYSRSGGVAHFFSWVFGLTSIFSLWKIPDISASDKFSWAAGLLVVASLALAIIVGAGFNFDLAGIE